MQVCEPPASERVAPRFHHDAVPVLATAQDAVYYLSATHFLTGARLAPGPERSCGPWFYGLVLWLLWFYGFYEQIYIYEQWFHGHSETCPSLSVSNAVRKSGLDLGLGFRFSLVSFKCCKGTPALEDSNQ